jgi:hypothetical protein
MVIREAAGPVRIRAVSTNAGGAIYGTITVGALLGAEGSAHETYLATIAAALAAMVLYWVAHAYATHTEERLNDGTELTLSGVGKALAHEVTVLTGAALPLLTLVLFGLAGARLQTAVIAATWSAAAMIVAIELVAGIRAELTGRELAAQTAIGAALGCLVIAVRIILH